MAIINKTGITTGGTIDAEHVTRAIDALSGGSTDTVIATGSFNGSLTGTATTASYVLNAVSSSFATTASFATSASRAVSSSFATTASFATSTSMAVSSSFATTASFATSASRAVSSSFATTASFALNAGAGTGFPFTGSARITGSLGVTGSASFTGSLNVVNSFAASSSYLEVTAQNFLINADSVTVGSGIFGADVTFGGKSNLNLRNVNLGVGFVIPISESLSPTTGSMFFDSTVPALYIYDGTQWTYITLGI
jgi:hypothetical protein